MPNRDAPLITSSANPIVKHIRSLLRRNRRSEERAFVVEGVRCVFDAFAAGTQVDLVLLRADGVTGSLEQRIPADVPVRYAEPTIFDALSEVTHSQGIMATVSIDALPGAVNHDDTSPALLLVVDGVKDPGNLGTLLRSAAGGGVSEVLLTRETVDPFNPKSVRAGMGAHFRIPIRSCSHDGLHKRLQDIPTVALADATGTADYWEIDWTGPSAIVVGGEADGPSPATRSHATTTVRIPLCAGVESLNAGVAGSLLIFEVARQRRGVNEP